MMADSARRDELLPMNRGLVRIHKIVFYFYASLAVIIGCFGVAALMKGDSFSDAVMGLLGLFFLPIGLIHLCAAWGAARGKPWSRALSAVIGCLMFLGFPIGTVVAIYIFLQLGDKWHGQGIEAG